MPKPKILIFDLETGGFPGGFKADMGYVLNFGWKWLGEKKVHMMTVDQFPGWFNRRKGGVNDKPLIKAALAIMEQADLLVAHYGERFDRRFLQGRCVIHGFEPPPPTKLRDTWRIARAAFAFSSNRLMNLSETLGLTHKKHQKTSDEWPGWWLRAMAGDASAIHEMARYCKKDVEATEELYLAIRQYDNTHPRLHADRATCRLCGSAVEYRGYAWVGENKYRRYVCTRLACRRWGRETTAYKEAK